jgi:hypothetical protein
VVPVYFDAKEGKRCTTPIIWIWRFKKSKWNNFIRSSFAHQHSIAFSLLRCMMRGQGPSGIQFYWAVKLDHETRPSTLAQHFGKATEHRRPRKNPAVVVQDKAVEWRWGVTQNTAATRSVTGSTDKSSGAGCELARTSGRADFSLGCVLFGLHGCMLSTGDYILHGAVVGDVARTSRFGRRLDYDAKPTLHAPSVTDRNARSPYWDASICTA